jgi:hypothetical protein
MLDFNAWMTINDIIGVVIMNCIVVENELF